MFAHKLSGDVVYIHDFSLPPRLTGHSVFDVVTALLTYIVEAEVVGHPSLSIAAHVVHAIAAHANGQRAVLHIDFRNCRGRTQRCLCRVPHVLVVLEGAVRTFNLRIDVDCAVRRHHSLHMLDGHAVGLGIQAQQVRTLRGCLQAVGTSRQLVLALGGHFRLRTHNLTVVGLRSNVVTGVARP